MVKSSGMKYNSKSTALRLLFIFGEAVIDRNDQRIRKRLYIMKFIETFREGEMISDIYLCKNKQTLKTKAGKSYYSMILQDKTGTIDAKIWEITGGN